MACTVEMRNKLCEDCTYLDCEEQPVVAYTCTCTVLDAKKKKLLGVVQTRQFSIEVCTHCETRTALLNGPCNDVPIHPVQG